MHILVSFKNEIKEYLVTMRGSINSIKNFTEIENLILKLENKLKRELTDQEVISIFNVINGKSN